MQAHSTPPWLDAQGRFFNPAAQLRVLAVGPGRPGVVVDDALANPEGLRAWAAEQRLQPPVGYPYPGQVCDVPGEVKARVADFFSQHVRVHLGVRRVLDCAVRLSVIDTPAEQLAPVQWLCHRDRGVEPGSQLIFAASVLYLFHDAGLGGTAFYEPRQSPAATEQLVADSQQLDAHNFGLRYALRPAYMAGSNAYFERTARVPAVWNRLIFYDASAFHSAEVDPARLSSDPLHGRLTLNCFITCRRASR